MASVDSLSIQITASATSATRRVNELCDALNRLVGAIAQLDTSKFADLSGNVNNLSQGLTSLKGAGVKQVEKVAQALNNVSTEGNVFEPIAQGAAQMAQEAQVATQNTNKMAEAVNTLDATPLADVSSALQTVDSSLNNTTTRMTGFRGLLANLRIIVPTDGLATVNKEIDRLQSKITELKERMEFKSKRVEGYVDSKAMERDQASIQGLITELDRLRLKKEELESHGGFRFNTQGFADLTTHLSNVNNRLNGFISRLFRARATTRATARSTREFSLSATKLASELFRVSRMLKLMVTRMALRAVIREVGNGFKSLALHSQEFDNAMSGIINSSKKLAYSFSGMVGPLISALAPALTYVIGLLTKFLNLLNQLFSALSGKSTFAKAKDFTGKWSDSIKDANKNAKELKKTVLGFDELNQLQDKHTSGGDTSGNIVDMYEDVEIDKNLQNLADKIKKIFDQIMTPIKKAWAKMGDFVVNSWKKAFSKVKDLLKDVGEDFLEVWNQEATVKMLEKIFHIIGNIGNVVANLAEQFDKAWNKNKVGLHILENIRDIIDIIVTHLDNMVQATVDWAATLDFTPILEAFNNWLSSLEPVVDSISGVFEDFYTTVLLPLGKWTIEDGLPKLIQVFVDFNEKVEWETIRMRLQRVWEALEPFAQKVGEGLIIFIQDCADAVAKFLNSKAWDSFIDSLIKWMNDVQPEDVARTIKLVAGAIITLKGALFLLSGIHAINILTTEIGTFLALFGAGSGAAATATTITSIGTAITGLAGALGSLAATAGIIETLKELINQGDKIKQLNEAFEHPEEVAAYNNELKETVKTTGEYEGRFGTVILQGYTWSDALKDFLNPLSDVNWGLSLMESHTEDLTHDTKEYLKSIGFTEEELVNFKANLDTATTSLNTNADAVSKNGSTTDTTLKNSANDYKDFAGDVKESLKGVSDGLTGLGTDTKVEFDNMELEVANSQLAMSGTLQTLSKDVSDCGEDMISTADDIKGAFDEKEWTLDGIAKGLTKSFEEAKKGIKGVWNSIAEKLNGEYEIGSTKFHVKLPKFFAKGGFPEDGFFFANSTELVGRFDNGKTAVANNEQIVEGIRQGVYEAVSMAMSTSQGGGDKNVYTTIQIDGETIARAVTKGQNSIGRRYSPTMS